MPTLTSAEWSLVLFVGLPLGIAAGLAAALSISAVLFKNKGNDQ